MPTFTNGESNASVRAKINTAIVDGEIGRTGFKDVAAFLADTSMGYGLTAAYPVIPGQRFQAGGFWYEVAEANATDHHVITAGAVKAYVLPGADGSYNWLAWGVKVNDASTTANAQAAIDFILSSGAKELIAPAGHYVFSQLRLFNAAGNERAKRGKITLRGEGQLELTEVYRGETISPFYGTIIQINEASSDGLLLANDDTLQRGVKLENLTVIYGGSGYAIDAKYVPFVELKNVSVRITSTSGSGINLEDVWGGILDRVFCSVDVGLTSAGTGVRLSASLFAGNISVTNSVIEQFYDNFHLDGGQNFANVIFDNTTFERFMRHGLLCESPIWNLVVKNGYLESSGALTKSPPGAASGSYIKVAPASGTVTNFELEGAFFLGGTGTVAWTTAPIIDLTNVNQAKLNGIKYFRPYTPLVNLNSLVDLRIDGVDVQADNTSALPTGPLYMITGSVAARVMLNRATITASSKLAWCDSAAHHVSEADGSGIIAARAMSYGRVKAQTIGLGAIYDMANDSPRPLVVICSATAGTAGAADVAVRLPRSSSVSPSDMRVIINDPASTQDVLLYNGALSSTIATVTPGQMATCYADAANDKWVIMVGSAAYGT